MVPPTNMYRNPPPLPSDNPLNLHSAESLTKNFKIKNQKTKNILTLK